MNATGRNKHRQRKEINTFSLTPHSFAKKFYGRNKHFLQSKCLFLLSGYYAQKES